MSHSSISALWNRVASSWLTITICVLPHFLLLENGLAQNVAESVQTHISSARRQVSLKHFSQAEAELRAALALSPTATDAHFLLGLVLFEQNRAADSLAEYTIGARSRPPTAEELMTVASDYVLLKDLPDADKWFSYTVKLDPTNARAWYLLGRAQYNEDHNAQAELSFKRVLDLHPKDVRAEYNLGLVDERLQRSTESLAAYRAAISWQSGLTAQDPQPYLDLGMLLLSQGNNAEALTALREAVRFGPENPLIQQELGRAFESLGQYDDALAALRHAVALAPESQQPHFFLARVLRRQGRNDEAATEYAIVSRMLGSHSDTPTPNTDVKSQVP